MGALVWVLNPFIVIIGSSWVTVFYVAAWLPWLFWALDRLFDRPTPLSAFFLGTILALYFLQGYVQWVAYSILSLGLYALFRLMARTAMHRLTIAYYLLVAALIFLILAVPLLLPMIHAVEVSFARSTPLWITYALDYRVVRADLLRAQVCLFRPHFIFGLSSAVLYCPALLLLPLMVLRFFSAKNEIRQRLFPLLVLSLLALLFSSRWHLFLSILPVMDRFRWPFKVFILADFFLLASLVWSVSSWTGRRSTVMGSICLAVVLVANLAISLSYHHGNTFSKTGLPTSHNPSPPGLDPHLGRVIAIDDLLPEAASYRFFTHAHSTFFGVPSLGGYDPLVGRDQLGFALGLDFPNVFTAPNHARHSRESSMNARRALLDRGSPNSTRRAASRGAWTAFGKLLATEPDRLDLMKTRGRCRWSIPRRSRAEAMSLAADLRGKFPAHSGWTGVDVAGRKSSLGPTDGWWCRIDGMAGGSSPIIENDRPEGRWFDTGAGDSTCLEVTYFDPEFHRYLWKYVDRRGWR